MWQQSLRRKIGHSKPIFVPGHRDDGLVSARRHQTWLISTVGDPLTGTPQVGKMRKLAHPSLLPPVLSALLWIPEFIEDHFHSAMSAVGNWGKVVTPAPHRMNGKLPKN
nr:uncharacterized protein LOC115263204 [Aedes albopictus]